MIRRFSTADFLFARGLGFVVLFGSWFGPLPLGPRTSAPRPSACGGFEKVGAEGRSVLQASQTRYVDGLTRVQISQTQSVCARVRSTSSVFGTGFVDEGIDGGVLALVGWDLEGAAPWLPAGFSLLVGM